MGDRTAARGQIVRPERGPIWRSRRSPDAKHRPHARDMRHDLSLVFRSIEERRQPGFDASAPEDGGGASSREGGGAFIGLTIGDELSRVPAFRKRDVPTQLFPIMKE